MSFSHNVNSLRKLRVSFFLHVLQLQICQAKLISEQRLQTVVRLIAPCRILERKLGDTNRLLVSSKVWSSLIPTKNCDILLTLPSKTEDQTLMWILSRLKQRVPEIIVHVRHHNNGMCGFFLTATYESLLKGAEKHGLMKSLTSEYGGGKKEFSYDKSFCFESIEEENRFLTSQERQNILLSMLMELRAEAGEQLGRVTFHSGQSIVPKLLSKNVISQVFPLHCTDDLVHLRKTWVQTVFSRQPLDDVCEYFGVKIALYFAYLGYYTMSLSIPSVFGVIIWIMDLLDKDRDFYTEIFAFINVLWAALYLEMWKRKMAEYTYRWGTLDKEDEFIEDPRPLYTVWKENKPSILWKEPVKLRTCWEQTPKNSQIFYTVITCLCRKLMLTLYPTGICMCEIVYSTIILIFPQGDLLTSKVTGRLEPQYPAWKRNLYRYFISLPVVVICLCVVFIVMLLIFELQEIVDCWVREEELPYFLSYGPKVLLALVIGILDEVYKWIAVWLTEQENYRVEETYENQLILKLVLFQFVNGFLSLFYIAFYLQDMDRLKQQLAALLITRQVIGNIKEAFFPYVFWKVKLFKYGYDMTADMSPHSLAKFAENIKTGRKDSIDNQYEDFSNEKGTLDCDSSEQDLQVDLSKTKQHNKIGAPKLTQAESQSAMRKYEDTYEDYLEMFIQFGYVTLFSAAFPLAAVCALLNNVIEIRSDAFKLCCTMQRPFGKRVSNIGLWQTLLELMSILAVIVNCALMVISGDIQKLIPNCDFVTVILLMVIVEHLIIGLKYLISCSIPALPEWIAKEKASLEFKRREALKRMESRGNLSATSPGQISPESKRTNLPSPGSGINPFITSQAASQRKTSQVSISTQTPTHTIEL